MKCSLVCLPVGFVQNDNFMPSWRQIDLLRCKHFNPITYDIDTAIIRSIQLQNRISHKPRPQQLIRQTQNTGSLPSSRWPLKSLTNPARFSGDSYGKKQIGNIPGFADDFKATDNFFITDNVFQKLRAILLNPKKGKGKGKGLIRIREGE